MRKKKEDGWVVAAMIVVVIVCSILVAVPFQTRSHTPAPLFLVYGRTYSEYIQYIVLLNGAI